jgi:hypothetical protein
MRGKKKRNKGAPFFLRGERGHYYCLIFQVGESEGEREAVQLEI